MKILSALNMATVKAFKSKGSDGQTFQLMSSAHSMCSAIKSTVGVIAEALSNPTKRK